MARILIVEDSPTQAIQIEMILEHHSVTCVTNGVDAVAALTQSPPELVVTDLHIPQMNGLQLVEYIRDHHGAIPVILMTADGSEEIAVQALKSGAASYIPKRFIARDLIPTVDDILRMLRARLNQARLTEFLISSEASYRIHNDHDLAGTVIAKFEADLRATRETSETLVLHVTMALKEAISNAIDHGNLELNSDIRDEDANVYWELGRQRSQQEPYCRRRVTVTTRASRDEVTYVIRDEGPGFDVASLPDPTAANNVLRAHGRGMVLMRSFMDEVLHNEKGNEITLVKRLDARTDDQQRS